MKPDTTIKQPSPDLVEVRVTALRYSNGEVTLQRGAVAKIPRAEYDATCETRDGIRRPSHAFALISDDRAVEQKKADAIQGNQDRFMAMREAAIQSQEASERSRAQQRVLEAENAQRLASAIKPLERPGATRVS